MMKQKWWRQTRFRWAALGSLLSFVGPLVEWLFLQLVGNLAKNQVGWRFVFMEVWTLLLFTSFGYLLGRSRERVEQIALFDSLTGVFNRGYLMEQFKELLALHDRYQQPLTLILFDLDRFKRVNDRYGHLVGDKTLKAVTNSVASTCRASDVFGRFGGEEFLLLCPNTEQEEGELLAERIRHNVAQLPPEVLGYPGPQTVSLSIGAIPTSQTFSMTTILGCLDQALYRAKANGRNQLQIAHFKEDEN